MAGIPLTEIYLIFHSHLVYIYIIYTMAGRHLSLRRILYFTHIWSIFT